jgi:[ribosomal protein S18]-alanine N-acetyltransferase
VTEAEIVIRAMARADIDRVIEIAQGLLHAPRWTREAYEAAVDATKEPRRIALVAEAPNKIVAGFTVSLLIGPDAELETIAVATERQRQGIGQALIHALLEAVRRQRVTKVLLEVRNSNSAAQHLYRSNGFSDAGRRSGYYSDPKEDAVLMERIL